MNGHSRVDSKEAGFHYIYTSTTDGTKAALFEVRSGISHGIVRETAICLVDSLKGIAVSGLEDGIDPSSAFAMQMLLEMVSGLLKSLEVSK